MAKVELAMDSRCCTGESPVSYASGSLLFVDIEGCKIHAFDTVANRAVREVATNGRKVGNVVPCASPALPGFDLLASLEVSLSILFQLAIDWSLVLWSLFVRIFMCFRFRLGVADVCCACEFQRQRLQ
jgi:hypothetical protein